jgi:glycosyltransferase involved in cell wall biosynthesis
MCVSVLILTFNEEINLPGCLESVAWSDDIVVFDSFSTDRTVEIAKDAGARVFQRKFDNYAAQRNAALYEIKYKHRWVFMVDADERVTQELAEEIKTVLTEQHNGVTLYRMRRKDIFFGKWLKHGTGSRTWFGRLVQVGRVAVKREVNEEYHTDGEVGHLKEYLIHYPFNKGIPYWFERHNRYSTMEAEALIKETQSKLNFRQFFSFDPTIRRKFLKQLAYRLPCRPFLVFCYMYIMRFGFIDGKAGLAYCRLRAIYEYMIDLKVAELRRQQEDLSV